MNCINLHSPRGREREIYYRNWLTWLGRLRSRVICLRNQGKLVRQGHGWDHQSWAFQVLIATLTSAILQHFSIALDLPFSWGWHSSNGFHVAFSTIRPLLSMQGSSVRIHQLLSMSILITLSGPGETTAEEVRGTSGPSVRWTRAKIPLICPEVRSDVWGLMNSISSESVPIICKMFDYFLPLMNCYPGKNEQMNKNLGPFEEDWEKDNSL